jgi:ABC-type dipeptide/oligopeptide/nickel transport system permease subunit
LIDFRFAKISSPASPVKGRMEETGKALEGVKPVKGRSLWADAWRRLIKNRMSVFGMIVVVLMSLTAIFAGIIAPFPATYQQLWVGAKPPGYTHPEVLNAMALMIGKPPEVPERVQRDGSLRFLVVSRKGEDFRVLLKRRRVRKIVREIGAESLKQIAVKGESEVLQQVMLNGSLGPEIRDTIIEKKKDLPSLLGISPPTDRTRWVLIFRRFTEVTDKPGEVLAEVKEGNVVSLTVEGKAVDAVTLQGRKVVRFEHNGAPVIRTHWLGTDQVGRDVLSRVIYGGRISLLVGLVATIVSLIIGVVYGASSGYFGDMPIRLIDLLLFAGGVVGLLLGSHLSGGHLAFWGAVVGLVIALVSVSILLARNNIRPFQALKKRLAESPLHFLLTRVIGTDNFMMRAVDILYGLPYMFLVILLLVNFGRDIVVLFIALGAVQWLTMARIVRGQVLSLREKEFIEAARMAGAGHAALLFRHLIPNTLGIVAVYTTLTIPAVILQESFLAFIGLAVQYKGENLASWGALVDEGRQALGTGGDRWWMLIFPSLAMAVTLFSLNFLGDGLRDALDPQQKGRT